jgi:hypothetical protein
MEKRISISLEILSTTMLFLSIGFYFQSIINAMKNYSVTQGIGLDLIILIYSIVLVIVVLLLVLALVFITRYQKQHKLFSCTTYMISSIKKHKIISSISILLTLIIISLLLVINLQDSFIYYPSYSQGAENILKELDEYSKVEIESDNGDKYSGWFKMKDPNAYTIIYFGGNAQSSAMFFSQQNSNDWEAFNDYNFLMIDYPGYGLSDGKPSELGIYEMSLTVFDYVMGLSEIDNSKIIVLGYSLGTGVATYVAQNRDFYELILIAPFTSMIDIFNTKFPIFYGPLTSLISNKFDSLDRASEINEKTLIIYSLDDEVINSYLSAKISDEVIDSTILVLDNIHHNDFFYQELVLSEIDSFINHD